MVEAGVVEALKLTKRWANARCDQVGVKPGRSAMPYDLLEIGPDHRLTAGEMDMKNAQGSGLAQDAKPCCGVKLRRTPV
jgi:hypothetical protein